jgi:hypothetical protein
MPRPSRLRAARLLLPPLLLLVPSEASAGTAQEEIPALTLPSELAHPEVIRALSAASSFLPVRFALDALAGVPVAVHRMEHAGVAQVVEQDGLQVLLLSERSYFAHGSMVDLGDAAVDTVAHLFEALFTLHARRSWLADPSRRAELEQIAGGLYVDLPAERRVEALIDAQAQYAGHLASIAAAVERSARRTGARFCARLDGPLFRLWERTGTTIEYLGTIYQGDGAAGAWRTSRIDLPAALRDVVRAGPLESRWSGRAREDFGSRYCR